MFLKLRAFISIYIYVLDIYRFKNSYIQPEKTLFLFQFNFKILAEALEFTLTFFLCPLVELSFVFTSMYKSFRNYSEE